MASYFTGGCLLRITKDAASNTPQLANEAVLHTPDAVTLEPKRPITPRDAREVYLDVMMAKNRGFPLWIPSPNTLLPPEYRCSGVSIGDVGVLTPEGGFDFIFNIFADAGDPVNANSGLSRSFVPLIPPLRSYEVQRFNESPAGSMISDDSFGRTDDAEDDT